MEVAQPSSAFMKTKVWLDDDLFGRLNLENEGEKETTVKEICNIAQKAGLSVSNSMKDPSCIEGTLSGINILQQGMDTALSKLNPSNQSSFLDLLRETLLPKTEENGSDPVGGANGTATEDPEAEAPEASEKVATPATMAEYTKNMAAFMQQGGAGIPDYSSFMNSFMLAYQSLLSQPGANKVAKTEEGGEEGEEGGTEEKAEEPDPNIFPNLKQIVDMMKMNAKTKRVTGGRKRRRKAPTLTLDGASKRKTQARKTRQRAKRKRYLFDDVVAKYDAHYHDALLSDATDSIPPIRQRRGRKILSRRAKKDVEETDLDLLLPKTPRVRVASLVKNSYEQVAEGLRCKECGFTTHNRVNIREHIMRQHRERKLKCAVCQRYYATRRDLQRHMRSHLGFPCERCGKMFRTNRSIKEHLLTHDRPYACTICGKCFRTTRGIKEHEKKHEPGYVKPSFACEICGSTFSTPYVLNVHIDRAHRGIDHKNHQCEFCGKAFINKHILLEHRNTHTGDTPFKCNICGEGFTYTGAVRIHKRKAHNIGTNKTYQCMVCFKTYPYSSSLRTHMKLHQGGPQFECETCGRGFYQKGAMQRHMMTHTGERPVKCSMCSSGFYDTKTLRRHMMDTHKVEYVNRPRGKLRKVPDHPSAEYLAKNGPNAQGQMSTCAAVAAAATAAVFGNQPQQQQPQQRPDQQQLTQQPQQHQQVQQQQHSAILKSPVPAMHKPMPAPTPPMMQPPATTTLQHSVSMTDHRTIMAERNIMAEQRSMLEQRNMIERSMAAERSMAERSLTSPTEHYIPPSPNFPTMGGPFVHDSYLLSTLPTMGSYIQPEAPHAAPVTMDGEAMRRLENQYGPQIHVMSGNRLTTLDAPLPAHSHHQQSFNR